MKFKIITVGLLFVLALYGINTVLAADTADVSSNQTGEEFPCDDPLYDGSGYDTSYYNENKLGNQRGDMDGSQSQLKTQLKDGSGLGGMYGENACSGDCLYPEN